MKANKKIIITVVLIIVLVCVVYFINKSTQSSSADVSTQDKSAEELKLCKILSNIDGVGAADVMISKTGEEISGVIVVCEGAKSIMVRSDILNAVSTALGVDKKIIAVYSMTV